MQPRILIASGLGNVFLLSFLLFLWFGSDRELHRIVGSSGTERSVTAAQMRRELYLRHAEEVTADLLGREMVRLAAQESQLTLDVEELEARWFLLTQDPETKAQLDRGEISERRLRSQLESLVLLDQVTLHQYNPEEREKVLRDYYDRHKWDLEEVRVRHILMDSQNSAEDVAERLAAGVDFGSLAQRFSLDPLTRDQGGDLGWRRREDWTEELRPLVFLLPPGRASNPVSSKLGWHLFLVEEKRSTFEELHKVVERSWCRRKRTATMSALRERFGVKGVDRDTVLRKGPNLMERWRLPLQE